jgi:hypothetical protein
MLFVARLRYPCQPRGPVGQRPILRGGCGLRHYRLKKQAFHDELGIAD